MNFLETLNAEQQRQLLEYLQKDRELTVIATLKHLGLLPEYISRNMAFKKYGKSLINSWVKDRLIVPTKFGKNKNSKIRFDYLRLETIAKLSPEVYLREKKKLSKTKSH